MMLEDRGVATGLLVRAEPLEWAEEVSHRMVEVERLDDGALLLDVEPAWAEAINAVLVSVDPEFFIEFDDGERPHQIRLEGGDSSSDSYCYPS